MIVPTKLHHLEEISIIENNSFKKPWSKIQIQSDIQSEMDSENWVSILDEQVVGYMFGWKIMDQYHLNNIAVHPDFICRRIGTQLMRHLISILISKRVYTILLEVSAKNIPAIKFYQSFGFTSEGTRKNYYAQGENAVLFNLSITKND